MAPVHRLSFSLALILAGVPLWGCTDGGPSGGDDDDASSSVASITGIRIEPADSTVIVSPGVAQEVQFQAVIERDDGSEEFTNLVSWGASNVSLGTLSSLGVFSTFDDRGGTSNISANYLGFEATTRLTVVYSAQVVVDGLVSGVETLFDGDTTPSPENGPRILYPYSDVVIPKNLPEISFMWDPGEGSDQANLFRLTFRSSILDVEVFTEGTSFNPSGDLWRIIASSAAGGEISVTLAGLRYHVEEGAPVADTSAVETEESPIRIDRLDASGSIYYFSASDSGIKRISLDRRGSEDFMRPLALEASCVSCHVLNPESNEMAVAYQLGNQNLMAVVDITGGADNTVTLMENEPGDMMTFSPDGEWLLVNGAGSITLYSTADWESYEVPVEGLVAQPEWSPDGDRITVVYIEDEHGFIADTTFNDGGIAYLRVTGPGEIDPTPVVLVPADGTNNNYFPTFSPDGEWLAFTRAVDEDSYWASSAEVWMVHKDGGTPIRLGNANGGTGLQNSWPRWGPLSDSDFLYLTFSSNRPYGFFNLSAEVPQIWVTAIDELAAEAGQDPSFPSFWLVDQDISSHNHIPVWGSE